MSDSQVGAVRPTVVAARPGHTRRRFRLPAAPLTGVVAEIAAVLLLCPILLFSAFWNEFPFVFFDTGAYVLEGFAKVFVPERSAVYSLFLYYVNGRADLWFVAIAQAAITAFVLTEFVRTSWPQTSLWKLLGIGAILTLFTSVGWFVGQIEPDCMTGVLALAFYMLAFRAREVGWVRAPLLVAVAGFAIGAHPSHLGLSAGLIICLAALKITALILRGRGLPKPVVILPVLSFALGLGLVLAANYSLTHKVFISKSGSIFLAARLMGDGVVKHTLDDICPTQHLKLCRYKDNLPPTADAYLWAPDSPFNKLGRFYGFESEYETIVHESLMRYPLTSLATGLWDSFRQFWMFRTGDGVTPQEWVLSPEFRNFMPVQYKHYLEARQQRGVLRFTDVNVVHYPLALLALLWLAIVLYRAAKRQQWDRAALPAFIMLSLIGNALVCGLFSGPHDRYQSRLIWVAVLVMLLTVRPRLERFLRKPVESGT